MALEDAKTEVDVAFTREDRRGLAFENAFGGATSFLRRSYTKDLAGVDLAEVAITSGLGDMQRPLNLVWEHLLPAMGAAPLAEDRAAAELLEQKLSTLRLNPQTGASTAPGAAAALGKTYMFAKNAQKMKSFRLDSTGDGISITIGDANGEHRVICGAGEWRAGSTTLESGRASAVAASGAWTGDQTYTAQIYFNETPFRLTLDCHYDGDRLDLDAQMNVGFAATARPRLSGTRR